MLYTTHETSWCERLPLLLQVWRANSMGGWDEEQVLHGHKDWVRDAAWAPNLGMPLSTIASAGQDGQVGWGDCCMGCVGQHGAGVKVSGGQG
jgi:WD40 repeat protein